MSVTLRKRKNKDGTTSLRLDIYSTGKHKIETLKNLKLVKGTTVADRETNRRNLQQAESIRVTRAAELEASNYGMVSDSGKRTIVTDWMQSFINEYKKKDVRNMQGALNRFSTYLKEVKLTGLTFGGLTPLIIEDFIDFLEANSKGEGASSYYNRFKKMIRQAYRRQLLRENVLDKVSRRVRGKADKKDVLTLAELRILRTTSTESTDVKRAFLFCCVTGLRWCDVETLKWQNIDLKNRKIKYTQAKTGETVENRLNDTAIEFLGEKHKANDLVFTLPSANGANKSLKAWVKRAGIEKKITWHNARHTFGTNLILQEVDVLTTSRMLGHSSLKHTQRYVDTARDMKEKAADKLNF